MSRLILGMTIAATIIIGLLTGGNFDRTTVAMPAWREVGLVGWASFSRHADLGSGMLIYPIMAIGGAAITLVAAVLFVLKGRNPRGARAPMVLAATFALVSLPFSFKAAPYMLSLRRVSDDDLRALQSAFSGYALWGRLQGVCHLACFFALVWSVAVLGRSDRSGQRDDTSTPTVFNVGLDE